MTRPPRLAEAILESLGAQPEFRDDVLGDLAEELAIRSAWDGEREARRWYGAGYIAGWLHRRAPVVAGLALGAVWSVLGLIVFGVLANEPAWYVFAMPFVTIAGTAVGGALRASVAQREVVALSTTDSPAAR